MQQLRQKFPILQKSIYANTAATGLLYKDLFEWRRQHDEAYLLGGSKMKQQSFEDMALINEEVARFFGCKTENVALTPNFTIALNLLLEGLPNNQKVLLLETDYPSVNWGFETRKFDIHYLKINADLEDSIYQAVKDHNMDILAISLVQWVNGIKIDLDFLKKLKHDFPQLMVIADGTQFCGTQVFDFEASGVDILGASAYKWLLSGYGNGFILVKDQIKSRFHLKAIGNGSVDRDASKRNAIPFCKHLEPGHLDSLNFGSLRFSLKFLKEIEMDRIEADLRDLSQKAKKGFSQLGLLEEAVEQRETHSTIFNIKGNHALFQLLESKGVVCAQRGNGIRLSFHFYNTLDEVDAIMEILQARR